MDIDMMNAIKAVLAKLEHSGIIERTGEMEWDERSREWQPVYACTELGRAPSTAGISLDDYQDRAQLTSRKTKQSGGDTAYRRLCTLNASRIIDLNA